MQEYFTVEREDFFHTLIAGTLRAGSTDEPAFSIAGQRLQHKTLK